MAYVTPPTFNSGDVLAADDLNILGDDIKYLKGITDGIGFSAVRVTRSASTSIPNNTWTEISFSAEIFDFGSWWSSGPSIVVPVSAIPAGYTTVAVIATPTTLFAANGAGYRAIRLLVNGTEEVQGTEASFATDQARVRATDFAVVAAGDVLTLEVFQNSGGALNASFTKITIARYAPVA